MTELPELWGSAECVEYLAVTRKTFNTYRREGYGPLEARLVEPFPAPALELAATPVWLADSVRAWCIKLVDARAIYPRDAA